MSHCSEVTPGKKIPTKLSTAPRPCSATQPVSSGLLSSFFTFPVASPKIFFSPFTHTLLHNFPGPSGLWRVFPTGSLLFPRAPLGIASAKGEHGQGRGSHAKVLPHHQTHFFNDSVEPVAQQRWRDPKAIKILCHGSLELQPASVVSNQCCWGRSSKVLFFK